MRPLSPVAVALIAVALAGCTQPSGPAATNDLALDTAFTFVPGDAADNATRVDNGTPAIGLTVWVKVRATSTTPNRTWDGDPGCRMVQDAPPVCDDVPDRSSFVVPPPDSDEEGSPRQAWAAYPLGPDGAVVLKSPEPVRLDVGIQGDYGQALKERMQDPSACDRPSGATHGLGNLTGNASLDRQEPRPGVLLRGDAQAVLAWHGWCADDAF